MIITTPTSRPAPSSWPPGTASSAGELRRAEYRGGSHLDLDRVTVRSGSGQTLLDQLTMSVGPGELVAIIGSSGSGKSTLLDVMAGNIVPSSGQAYVDGSAASALDGLRRRDVGFVPQDDDLHDDLPLGRMLEYAARLRLPSGPGLSSRIRDAVDRALVQVELADSADVLVRRLSGGQRRRASIAIELLTSPRACLMDEPTSGLDPVTAESVVGELRALADSGRTVVFVTHNADDLVHCDRIVAVGTGGRVGFDGTSDEVVELVGSNDPARVHRALTSGGFAQPPRTAPVGVVSRGIAAANPSPPAGFRGPSLSSGPSRWRQLTALTARTLELVARSRLTSAIMIGSPAMVVAMFAILFQPGAFDPAAPSPISAIMIAFWMAFGAFFFGLTYGLLQIVPEVKLMRREWRAGVGPGLQVLAKVAALSPVLIVTNVAMLAVLSWFDRLPSVDWATFALMAVTLALDAVAALTLGLLASALVRNSAQASLALPMLCFPAVLFSGAVLPVPVMAPVGRIISAAMPDRWAFESIGRDLGLRPLFAGDHGGLGPALLSEYGDTWTQTHPTVWAILVGFGVVLTLATWVALSVRCRRSERALGASSS